MRPVRQNIFVASHPKGHGNCMSACMASILELPLKDVVCTASDECHHSRNGWWSHISAWLADRGLALRFHDEAPAGYSIGTGPSPRGPFNHAVVCKNGKTVFDPHHSDDGVESFAYFNTIVPLEPHEDGFWGS